MAFCHPCGLILSPKILSHWLSELIVLVAKVFNKFKIKARCGIVVNGSGEPIDLIIASPMHIKFETVFSPARLPTPALNPREGLTPS
ncbi:MAG: hypothetical protein SLRJCFUN_001080 [Candidatus Fervidibacter sp.]|jgi:hypothetical protein